MMLRRTKPFDSIRSVSSMSPTIWIQPAHIGGLFFAPILPNIAAAQRKSGAIAY
jgi:hypothetical protein